MSSFTLMTFQFHKGTIKTVIMTKGGFLSDKFQFHKGTIKTNTTRKILLFVKQISIP